MPIQTGLQTDRGMKIVGILKVRRVDKNEVGLVAIGNTTTLTVQPSIETDYRRSNFSPETRGQIIDSDSRLTETKCRIEVDTIGRELLAMCLAGEDKDLVQAATPGQVKAFAAAVLGRWFDLGHLKVGNVVVEAASQTMQEGRDYLLHPASGQILFVVGGGIEAGDAVSVSYDAGPVEGDQSDGATLGNIKLELLMEGKDAISGDHVLLRAPRVAVTPTEAMSFMNAAEFQKVGLDGMMETPEGYTKPFVVQRFS